MSNLVADMSRIGCYLLEDEEAIYILCKERVKKKEVKVKYRSPVLSKRLIGGFKREMPT